MNDFTKEELLELIWLATNISYSMNDYAIYKKIQSMIDNYCEHEWVVESKNYDLANVKCSRCGVKHGNVKGLCDTSQQSQELKGH